MFDGLKEALGAINPTGGNLDIREIGALLGIALNVMLGVVVSVSSIGTLLSGIKYMMSRGDLKALASARQALTYSVVALVLGLGAFAVKAVVLNSLGISAPDLIDETPSF